MPITYTQNDVDHARRIGDEVCGVAFIWDLVSINGAGFTLLREPTHTDEDIARAEAKIRGDRDVVWLKIEEVKS